MPENQSLTRQQWFDLVKEHKASGLTQAEFCQQNNLSLCRLGYYTKKLREQNLGFLCQRQLHFLQLAFKLNPILKCLTLK